MLHYKLKPDPEELPYIAAETAFELDLMYKSSHPYMFRLLNHYETQTHVFMIFEEYDGDSLDNKILKGRCDLHDSKKYLVEVMLGVQHMHLFNLYNLNVNPENILFTFSIWRVRKLAKFKYFKLEQSLNIHCISVT